MSAKLTKLSPDLTLITINEKVISDYAQVRNHALSLVSTPWAFFLDQDEKLSSKSISVIKTAIKGTSYNGFYCRREDLFLGKKLRYGETSKVKLLRLGRVGKGKWLRPVHEYWDLPGPIGDLEVTLQHHSHPNLAGFLLKIDDYSSIEADYRYRLGKKSSLIHIWLYPLCKFMQNYFYRLGILDGVPGIIMAIMMSFHSYLTWTKLYLKWQQN